MMRRKINLPMLPEVFRRIVRDPVNPDLIAVGYWEHPVGCVWYEAFAISELPNDLVSSEDLERFGIDLADAASVC